jgi:uncharacterized protein YheU (UPF0270 family)
VEIPWSELSAGALRSLIEEFVSRDGTDYGTREVDHEDKVEQVARALREGRVRIVFDETTETCDIRVVP